MKFILESQIPGFQEKSKAEKKAIRKIAHETTRGRYSLLVGLCAGISIVGIRILFEDVFEIHSKALPFTCVVILAGIFGALLKISITNPAISQIVKNEPNQSSEPT